MSEPARFSEAKVLLNFAPDIGNALAGVLSATQALLNGAASDPVFRTDLLGDMEANLQYLRFIYENWVVSGSVNVGKLELVRRDLEPSTWLVNFLAAWPQKALDKRLRWEANVHADHPGVRIDRNLVELALENLLSVSIALAPARSLVRVSSGFSREDESIWIEVSDQGPELSGETLASVLDRPELGRLESPRLKDGRILGLLVAGAIAQAHGGRLESVNRVEFDCSMRLSLQAV